METFKPLYFTIYRSVWKFTVVLIVCFFTACNRHNQTQQILSTDNVIQVSPSAINVNTASVAELEKLPHIGTATAREIIEHREKFGRFRRPEYIMLVRGISDRQFREMRNLIRVE